MAGEGVPFLLGGFGLVALLVALGGVVVMARGVGHYRRARAFGELAPTGTDSLQVGDLAKVVGTVAAGGETVTGAFTGEAAVVVRHEVAEYRQGSSDGPNEWRPIHEDDEAVRFELADAEGSVRVDPVVGALEFDADRAWTTRVERGSEPPEGVADYVARTGAVEARRTGERAGLVWGERRRYREYALRPGDDVLVYGRVTRDPGGEWGDSLLLVPDPDEGGLLTDLSAGSLATRARLRTALYLVGGAAMVLAPVAAGIGLLGALGMI